MIQYLLRAEGPRRTNPSTPWPALWHVTRFGAAFALCTRPLQPATNVLPVQSADTVPLAERCPDCWERAFDELMLPAS